MPFRLFKTYALPFPLTIRRISLSPPNKRKRWHANDERYPLPVPLHPLYIYIYIYPLSRFSHIFHTTWCKDIARYFYSSIRFQSVYHPYRSHSPPRTITSHDVVSFVSVRWNSIEGKATLRARRWKNPRRPPPNKRKKEGGTFAIDISRCVRARCPLRVFLFESVQSRLGDH